MNNLQSIVNGITKGLKSPKVYKIEKESTQNPVLNYDTKSPGSQLPFAQPVPGVIGSLVGEDNPLEMNPVNGRHWKSYIADHSQRGIPAIFSPNPANLLAALSEPQDRSTVGSSDPWHNHFGLMIMNQKGYSTPNYRGY